MGPTLRRPAVTDPEPLFHDPAFAQFYEADNPWSPDAGYCLGLARNARSVLDLGSGTGRFCARVASLPGNRDICGADPAPGMLAVAERQYSNLGIDWVLADAGTLRLARRFDLIVMTGHAFQCLLTDADRAAAFATIAVHLNPEGRFILDSRNPAAREWERWTPDQTRRRFNAPDLGDVDAWTDAAWDDTTRIVTYEQHYRLPPDDRVISATSRIAFPTLAHLAAQIAAAGLAVTRWLGEWDDRPFTPDAPEIIAFGQPA
jgi:SAM-dependent methyltransferase